MNDDTRTTRPQEGNAAVADLREEIRALRQELSIQRKRVDDLHCGLAGAFLAAGVENPMTGLRVVDGQGRGLRGRRSARPALTLVTSSQLGA